MIVFISRESQNINCGKIYGMSAGGGLPFRGKNPLIK